MLTMVGRAATILVAMAILIGVSAPAWADDYFFGNTECGESGGPGCEVGAESGQSNPGSPGSDSAGDAEAPDGEESAAAAEAEPACDEVDPGTQECEVVIPGAAEDDDAVDPVEVAHEARDSLDLPEPQIATSPGAAVPVLVQVPVWLWIDEDAWQAQEAEADVPGGSVTVSASPSEAQWSMGDGTTVTCEGPGVAYDPDEHDPASASPECGHTYTRASTSQPDGTYSLEVDITWEVSWSSSDGDGGDLDALTTSASTERTVIESHGLVTGVD